MDRSLNDISPTAGMRAMIFAAGLGTRFKPWTDRHPKALALVNGKSLLQRNIEYLQQYGIYEVVVNVHHFADQVLQAIDNNNGWGSTVYISDERAELLETGGGLLKAAPLLQNGKPFVSLNADILTNLNLYALLDAHTRRNALISFAVSDRPTTRHFLFSPDERLCGWRNSSSGEERIVNALPGLAEKAYSCAVVFEPHVFDLIPQRGKFSLVETYLSLAAKHLVLGYDHSGDKLVDVGKPGSVELAEKLFP